jgi:hypothetical protein
MAIDTDNKKLAVMEWEDYSEPGIPLGSTEPFTQAEKQQLLWGYPGILWQELEPRDFVPRLTLLGVG